MAYNGGADARNGSTANIGDRESVWNRPEFGVQGLKTTADQIVGVPLVADPQRQLPNYFGEGPHYAHSAAQLFIGTNRTTLPTQIVLQVILTGSWYTQVVAPITPLAWNVSGVIQFDTLQFGPQLPQIVPEEGKTRIGSWEYDTKTFTVQRWGLGARFTHDFLLTPNGLARARGIMDQMQVSIDDHLKIGVIHALLHCSDSANARIAESQTQPSLNQQSINMQQTIDYFGILQFRDDGVNRLLTHARTTMSSLGGSYDTAIVHHLQQVYCINLNPKMTTYSEVGPVAYDNFTAIVGEGRRFGDSNGPRTFLVEEFYHGKGKAPLDFLRRKIVVGHYAVMFDHIPAGAGNRYDYVRPGHRDIQIMSGDNNGDDRVTISLEDALLKTGAWDEESGELIGPNHPSLSAHGNNAPLNSALRRCSFWYRTPGDNSTEEVVRHIGSQAGAYFSSWHNLAESVLKTLPAGNHAQILNAIYTISADIDAMANARYTPANATWAAAAAREANGVAPNGGGGPLPPWMTSGAALRRLRDYAQSVSAANLAASGLSGARLGALAAAVDVIQQFLIPHLVTGFGPNNAFLSGGSNNDSYQAAFDGFIDNCLAGHLRPLSSIGPGAFRAADAAALAARSHAAVPERRDAISDALNQAALRFQTKVTGIMGRRAEVTRNYDTLPPTRAAAAEIDADGTDAPTDGSVVYDPVQRITADAAATMTWATLKASLPPYAQRSLAGVEDAQVAAPGANTKVIAVATSQANKFTFVYTSAVGNAVYDRLVKLLVNYGTDTNAPDALANRAAVLTILSQVQPSDENYTAVLNAIGAPTAAQMTGAPVDATIDIAAALRSSAMANVIGRFAPVGAPGQPPSPITVSTLTSAVTRTMETVRREVAAVVAAGTAPAANQLDARNYVTGYYRASPAAVQSFEFNANIVPARENGGAGPVTTANELASLKEAIANAAPGTMGANSMATSRADRVLSGRVYVPDLNLPLALTGMPGGLPNVDDRVAISESYGTGMTANFSNVPSSDPAVSTLRSRYSGRASAAVPAPPTVAPVRPTPKNLSQIYTPNLGLNWEFINNNVTSIAHAAIARVAAVTPTAWANTRAMIRAGFLVPWTVLLCRPFGIFHTKTMFLVKSGLETMRTVLGQVRFFTYNSHI